MKKKTKRYKERKDVNNVKKSDAFFANAAEKNLFIDKRFG